MIYIVCSAGGHFNALAEQRSMADELLSAGLRREHQLDARSCEFVHNAWGKPLLKDRADIHFSVSHCHGGVALSIAGCRTGIDIEKIRDFSLTTARRVLAEHELAAVLGAERPEKAFFRYWTLKESYAKAVGAGMFFPLRDIRFAADSAWNLRCERENCLFSLFESDLGFLAAVCYLSPERRMMQTVEYCRLP